MLTNNSIRTSLPTQKRALNHPNLLRRLATQSETWQKGLAKQILYMLALCPLILSTACSRDKTNEQLHAEVKVLQEKAKTFWQSNVDSAIYYQLQSIEMARMEDDKQLEAELLSDMGLTYSMAGELDKSDSCYSLANDLYSENEASIVKANIYVNLGVNKSKRGLTDSAIILYKKANEIASGLDEIRQIENRTMNNIGLAFYHKGMYDSAQVYLLKSLKLAEQDADNESIGNALQNMGNCSFELQDFQKAKRLFERADSLYTIEKNYARMMPIKINRAFVLAELNLHDEALQVLDEAEELALATNIRKSLGAIYNCRGKIYNDQKLYSKSLEMQEKSLQIKREFADTLGIIHSTVAKSSIFQTMGLYSQAKEVALEGLDLIERKGKAQNLMNIYDNLAVSYEMTGEYKVANEYLKKNQALKDSLFNSEKYATIQELQTKYETKKKDLALLNSELKLSDQKRTTNGLLAVCVLLLTTFSFIFYIQRKKLKMHKAIARQNQELADMTAHVLAPNTTKEQKTNENGLSDEKINELMGLLKVCMEEQKMYRNPTLKIDELANAINTNRSYLSEAINSRLNKGFKEYVNFYRVQEAKRLLLNTNHRLATISEDAGFGSTQTFYATFKSFVQLTPTEYRKAAAHINEDSE